MAATAANRPNPTTIANQHSTNDNTESPIELFRQWRELPTKPAKLLLERWQYSRPTSPVAAELVVAGTSTSSTSRTCRPPISTAYIPFAIAGPRFSSPFAPTNASECHEPFPAGQAQQHQQFADMHRNMSAFAASSVTPMVRQGQQQQPQIAYHQVASPPPPTQPMLVESVSQQSYLPQQHIQIQYQPLSPVSLVQQVQQHDQPVSEQSHFPHQQQQGQLRYQSMSPGSPVQYQNQPMAQPNGFSHQQAQVTYPPMTQDMPARGIVRHESLPLRQQRAFQDVVSAASSTAVQPQMRYPQRSEMQGYAASPLPQTQITPSRALQSPPEAPAQQLLRSQSGDQSPQTALPAVSRPRDHRLMNLEK